MADWYPRYPKNFEEATIGWTLAERGAYSCLLDIYYAVGQPLPDDDSKLAALLRVSLDAWMIVAPQVRSKFQKQGKNGRGTLVHAKCELVIKDQRRRAMVSKVNGKKGGRPRSSENPAGTPAGYPAETQQGTQQQPSAKPQTDIQTYINPKKINGGGINGNGHAPPTKEERDHFYRVGCENWMRQNWRDHRAEAAMQSYLRGEEFGKQEYQRAWNERAARKAAAVSAEKRQA